MEDHKDVQRLQNELSQAEKRAEELKRLIKSITDNEKKIQNRTSSSRSSSNISNNINIYCNTRTRHIPQKQQQQWEQRLDGHILHLVIQWIGTRDTLSCVKVCRHWNEEINQPVSWRRLALQSAPELVMDMEQQQQREEQSSPTSDDFIINLNYKGIVRGLDWKPSPYFQKVQYQQFPDPSLSAQDLFLLVEAKDRLSGKSIGSWHDHFGNLKGLDDDGRRQRRYNNNAYPFLNLMVDDERQNDKEYISSMPGDFRLTDDDVLNWIYYNTIFTFRFFRCDTGQFVCLGYDIGYSDIVLLNNNDNVNNNDQQDRRIEDSKAVVSIEINRPDGNTGIKGDVARRVWSGREYSCLKIDMCYRIKSSPANGDKARTMFVINEMKCNFLAFNAQREAQKFVCQKEMLICFDALDWK